MLLVRRWSRADRDGVLLSPQARAAATRRAFHDPAGSADDRPAPDASLLLRDDLLRAAPALERLLASPPLRWGLSSLAVVAVAADHRRPDERASAPRAT